MENISTVGVVALTNIRQEPNYFHNFCAVPKIKILRFSSASVCSWNVLSMLLNFERFSASRS